MQAVRISLALGVALLFGCGDFPPQAPQPESLEPGSALEGAETPVTIHGHHFFPLIRISYTDPSQSYLDSSFSARLGEVELLDVTYIDSTTLTATVPAWLGQGSYVLTVDDPAGRTGRLEGAFTVLPVEGRCSVDAECADPCRSNYACVEGACVLGEVDLDADGDGSVAATCPGGVDCDDDPARCGQSCHPGQVEVCDGFDNDCNGLKDQEELTCVSGTLAVEVVGSGTVNKNPDKARYDLNEVVELTAVAEAGWWFDGWSGHLVGKANPENIVIVGVMSVAATFLEVSSPSYAEGFESGFTIGSDVGDQPGWFDGTDANGCDVNAGIGCGGQNGLAPGQWIFTWTAHPFDWNDPNFIAVVLQMDFETDANGSFDDDRVGWMITDTSNDSLNLFGVQLDPGPGDIGLNIEGYWDGPTTPDIRPSIVDLTGLTRPNTWYRLRAVVIKLAPTSARIQVELSELDNGCSPVAVVGSGSIADTSLLGAEVPDLKYFTATTIWPAFKNFWTIAGAADNAYAAFVVKI